MPGIDDFLFRRYSPVQGRWVSPDPAGLAAANITDPQTLNRYSYVGNRPNSNVDALGLYISVPWFLREYIGPFSTFINPFRWEHLIEPGGIGGGAHKAPLKPKDQKRYNTVRSEAVNDVMNPDCIAFCLTHGIDPTLLQIALMSQQGYSGTQSTITQGEAGVGITEQNQTVAAGFFSRPNVVAAGSITTNDAYFRNGNITESTVEHEALHNLLQIGDSDLQGTLGVPQNPANTSNINQALKDNHCTH